MKGFVRDTRPITITHPESPLFEETVMRTGWYPLNPDEPYGARFSRHDLADYNAACKRCFAWGRALREGIPTYIGAA